MSPSNGTSTAAERRFRSKLISSIGRVDLRVTDVGGALAFYRDVAGLEVAEQTASSAVLRAPGGEPFLHLSSDGVTAPAERRVTGLFHVAIRYPDKASLGDALARLVSAHYEIGAGDHGVSEALYVDDPSGNGIELYYDRARDQWPAATGDGLVGMTTGPVDLEGLLAAGRGQAAVEGQAPAGTDVGHVHLQVGDVERTVAFYTDVVGLDLTQRFGGQAGFFSSNGYHHHIGANTWNSRGAAPATRDHAGLDRIVFVVEDEDRLERLRLRLREYGHEVAGDEGVNLATHDPDGIELDFVLR